MEVVTEIWPLNVNLRAFPMRFIKIYFTLCMSTVTSFGMLGSCSKLIPSPFSCACSSNTSISSVRWNFKSTRLSTAVNFPFLILNRSIRSFTRKCINLAEFMMILKNLRPASPFICISRFLPIPNMALRGVREIPA